MNHTPNLSMARLIDSLGVTEEFAGLFSDASILSAMLEFEIALSRAQSQLGLIPASAAEAIAQVKDLDAAGLAHEARKHATLAIPFVKALMAQVGTIDASTTGFVHWGATSQDLLDTALILLLRAARAILNRDHERLRLRLHNLSEEHAGTVMLARTLLQPAPPITFGYKVAGWYAAIQRNHRRLNIAFEDALQLQFGGASGT